MAKKQATKQAASRELTKAQWKLKEIRQNWVAYLMVAPYMILFTLFTVVPVALSIVISFTDFNMLEFPGFVGLKNYVTLFFDDDIFLIAIKNTFIFACIVGPSSYIMSYLVAWFINELPPKVRALVTLIFYAPSISGQVYLIWVPCSLLTPTVGQTQPWRSWVLSTNPLTGSETRPTLCLCVSWFPCGPLWVPPSWPLSQVSRVSTEPCLRQALWTALRTVGRSCTTSPFLP